MKLSNRSGTMRKLALLTTIFVVLSAPTHAQDNATVQKLADQFAEAFNKNAASGVGDLYTEDAILVPPQADIRHGPKGHPGVLAPAGQAHRGAQHHGSG